MAKKKNKNLNNNNNKTHVRIIKDISSTSNLNISSIQVRKISKTCLEMATRNTKKIKIMRKEKIQAKHGTISSMKRPKKLISFLLMAMIKMHLNNLIKILVSQTSKIIMILISLAMTLVSPMLHLSNGGSSSSNYQGGATHSFLNDLDFTS